MTIYAIFSQCVAQSSVINGSQYRIGVNDFRYPVSLHPGLHVCPHSPIPTSLDEPGRSVAPESSHAMPNSNERHSDQRPGGIRQRVETRSADDRIELGPSGAVGDNDKHQRPESHRSSCQKSEQLVTRIGRHLRRRGGRRWIRQGRPVPRERQNGEQILRKRPRGCRSIQLRKYPSVSGRDTDHWTTVELSSKTTPGETRLMTRLGRSDAQWVTSFLTNHHSYNSIL